MKATTISLKLYVRSSLVSPLSFSTVSDRHARATQHAGDRPSAVENNLEAGLSQASNPAKATPGASSSARAKSKSKDEDKWDDFGDDWDKAE
jgi:hypothetical protein